MNLGILIIILTTAKYRTNSKFTNGLTAPKEYWWKSVLSLLRKLGTGLNVSRAKIFTLFYLQSQFLGAEARRFNRTNRTSTQHNQPTPNATTTMTKTRDTDNNLGSTEKLLGGLIILWMLIEILKLLINLLKIGFHHLFPPNNNNEEPDTPNNPYLDKFRPLRTGQRQPGPKKRIKLFEFEGPQKWDKVVRNALVGLPYFLVKFIFLIHQSDESNRLCIEFLLGTEKDAEKVFGYDTKPMDWVTHELHKIHAANLIERTQERRDNEGKTPMLRAGGGPRRSILQRNEALKRHDVQPTALCNWTGWWSQNSAALLDHDIDILVGGAKAPGTLKTYVSCFKHWSHFRELLNKTSLISENENFFDAEKDVLRFAALQFGPLGKAASTVNLYLQAIGYAHRVNTGINPLDHMKRVKLLMQGAVRRSGPPIRKLPLSCQDLMLIRNALDTEDIDSNIMFCTIALGWFFMLRRSEYLGPGLAGHNKQTFRHSVRTVDIEPLHQGKRTTWQGQVDSVSLHLEGSKTDWLNLGTVRTHGRIDPQSPNLQICIVANLQRLFKMLPAREQKGTHLPFARWENDVLISAFHVTFLIKTAAKANGLDPDKYTLHSLRSGGATALYRATGDLDLVGRFGRWKGKSIHGYLWESHQMLIGVASLMTREEGPIIHRATNFPHQRME